MENIKLILNEYIDYNDKSFRNTVFLSFACLVLWIILPILESRFKLLTKLINNDKAKAADFLAYLLIHAGSFRNYAYFQTVYYSKQYDLEEFNIICEASAIFIGLLSFYIFACASTKLGLRGMYFGDCFGFVLNNGEPITSFPFNLLSHPQYYCFIGGSLSFALFFRSPVGMFITVINVAILAVVSFFESIELSKIYGNTKNGSNKNKSK